MNKLTQLICFILMCNYATAQGISFVHNTTWDKVVAQAKAENKHIFVDAFTTWCGPCKQMSANIFPLKEVGDYYNTHYINLKLQMDVTKNDDENVKSWYSTAKAFETKYKVNAYPIYLIFNPQGELVHRGIGSSPAKEFIQLGMSGIDPTKQIVTLHNQYLAGKQDAASLYNLMQAAIQAGDDAISKEVYPKYIATQQDLFTKENLAIITSQMGDTKSDAFALISNNLLKVNAVLGNNNSSYMVHETILDQHVYRQYFTKNAAPNWVALEQDLKAKFPLHATVVTLKAKIAYFNNKKEWTNFFNAADAYINTLGLANVNVNELNSLAWSSFEQVTDKALLKKALTWSKQSFAINNQAPFIDTYANLLHKLGKQKDALQWEQKAITIAKNNGEDVTDYTDTYNKIKLGEKTWK